MKNTVDKWKELLTNPQLLKAHIQSKLHNRKQKSFVYKVGFSIPAAVLIPLFFKNGQAHILFTKRTSKVKTHKGQISFPGGKRDGTDPNLKFTALRETEEEVGITKKDIELFGKTDNFLTNTNFMVTPFVGFFNHPFKYIPSEDEIDRIIEVPLLHLLDDSTFRIEQMKRDSYTWNVHYYDFKGDIIWGVTGFLLSNFLSIIFDLKRDTLSEVSINGENK